MSRLNYRSHDIEFFRDFGPLLKLFENEIVLLNAVKLKLEILHRNRKCAKWMEISGSEMEWPSYVEYGIVSHCLKGRIS